MCTLTTLREGLFFFFKKAVSGSPVRTVWTKTNIVDLFLFNSHCNSFSNVLCEENIQDIGAVGSVAG